MAFEDIRRWLRKGTISRSTWYGSLSLILSVQRPVLILLSAAGWTYCAISVLSLLGEISASNASEQTKFWGIIGPTSVERLVQWLTSRQTTILHEDDFSMTEDEDLEAIQEQYPGQRGGGQSSSGTHIGAIQLDKPRLQYKEEPPNHAGMNGRCNKPADTCYTFWTGGSLTVSA